MKKSNVLKLLSLITVVCLTAFCFACKNKKGQSDSKAQQVDYTTLVDFIIEVEEGRDIKVLQITDVQIADGNQLRFEAQTTDEWLGQGGKVTKYRNYLRQIITRYNPDLIIMTGDNVYGQFDDSGESLLGLISFMDSFKIPWAPILGNHDAESYKGVDWQCQQYENSEYCLFKQRTLTGNGNYSVGVVQGGSLKRVFYMLDSNGAGNLSKASFNNGHTVRNFQGFAEDQIEWYVSSISALKEKCANVKLSFCFHIPFMAFRDASNTYSLQNGAINLDTHGREGDFGVLSGSYGSWDSDYRVWNSFKELGVDSVFVGHEHLNSASIMHEGIRLTYGQKSSTYDSHNYFNSQTGEIMHRSDGANEPMIGGSCINLSKTDGAIVNPHVLLYDKTYPFDIEEEVVQQPKGEVEVQEVSDTLGEYRGNQFARYTLSELDLQNPSLSSGFSVIVDSEQYSVKMRIKTLGEGYESGRLRISFFTKEGQPSDYYVLFKSDSVTISSHSFDFEFLPETEYDIEVGILRIYGGNTAFMFLKIDGELVDRWSLEEVVDLAGNYLTVRQTGNSDFCQLVDS